MFYHAILDYSMSFGNMRTCMYVIRENINSLCYLLCNFDVRRAITIVLNHDCDKNITVLDITTIISQPYLIVISANTMPSKAFS